MFRLALRNITARFGRIVLTALAIIVSTAFLSGTFIFRDTLRGSFDALFAKSFENVDVYVQSANSTETAFGFERRDETKFDAVAIAASVPGVVDAQATVQDDAVVIAKDGEPIQRLSRSASGGTINTGELSVWRIVDGRQPSGPGEVVLDTQTTEDGGYSIGDRVKVNASTSREFTLVGTAEYNDISTPGDSTWALFDEETAMDFILKPGYIDAVLVQGDGTVTDQVLAERVQAAFDVAQGPDVSQALTGAEIIEQSKTDLEKGLGFFTIFLSIFSLIALGVGCFVIYNVFSITTAQRRRENALLRAIGASRRQVTRSLLVEALAVGIFGSVTGLIAGAGLAIGIQKALDALGLGIPSRALSISLSTVAITLIAGIVTTMIAAIVPAFAAGRVAPVAAMSESAFEQVRSMRGRIIGAAVFVLIGVTSIIAVLAGADSVLLGAAVVAIFVGVLLFGPVMANPIARVLGAPLQKFRGITGAMSRGNVQRNPRRTARTAAPVLIGVALVAGATVFAASLKAQLRETIGDLFIGDYVINSSNGGPVSFGPDIVDSLNALPEVGGASGLGFASMTDTDGKGLTVRVIDAGFAGGLLNFDFLDGSFDNLTSDGMLISEGEAKRTERTVGSTFDVEISDVTKTVTVQGIYALSEFAGARVVDNSFFDGTSENNSVGFVVIDNAPGVSDADFRSAVDVVIDDYGIGELQDREQFIDGRSDIIDQSLSFIYGLLALSVIIAVFGIVLTMLLAVYERRREIGLLRAVGMTRAQVRTTVRWESVLTSLYGAIVGVVLGLVLGYIIIVSLKDQGLTTYTIPFDAIAIIVASAFVVGVLAAVIPAWRATRHDILESISGG
ncbi:MAG: FtsX-like permease family protein [Ilumatobacteraceae bacterium]